MIKKITKNLKLIVLSSLVISTSFAQSSLGRITFSSGGISNSGLSVTIGQSMAGSYRTADGVILTVGAQVGSQETITEILNIDKTSIVAENTKDSSLITVISNIDWTVSSNQSWATVSASKGSNNGSFKILLQPNTTQNARTALITVKGGDIVLNITVNQKGVVNSQDQLAINMNTLTIGSAKKDTVVKITSNRSWTITNPTSWISFSIAQGTGNADIPFTIKENSDGNERNAIIVFQAGSNNQFLSVTQKKTGTTGINQVEITNVIKVYPNPTSAQLNVQLNLEKINGVELSIFDYQGKEVGKYTTSNELTSIDVAHLASGTYILKVSNEQNQLNHQVKFNKID
jgi:hypothetical protein